MAEIPSSRHGGSRLEFFGAPIDVLTLERVVALAEQAMERRSLMRHTSLNVAKLIKMGKDRELEQSIRQSELVTVDGQGIALGLRLFGVRQVERIAGIDLFMALLSHCAVRGRHPFILGSTQANLAAAMKAAQSQFPGLEFAGSHHGYFSPSDENDIVSQIAQSRADCLFVAMSSPAKERFIDRHAAALAVPFIMGIGGSVDVLAGKTARAPQWMQRIGLEWFFRLLQEPRRMFWRYASTNTIYAFRLGKALINRLNPIGNFSPVTGARSGLGRSEGDGGSAV